MRSKYILQAGIHAFSLQLGKAAASADYLNEGQTTGTLAVNSNSSPFEFSYSTTTAHATNWIGLYHTSGGGPINQLYVGPSLLWKYATGTSGRLNLDATNLEPGIYQAYFLAQDGYNWLAQPINVTLQAAPAKLYFAVEQTTLHNSRRGDKYSARIDGLLVGKGSSKITFEKTAGDSWINVSSGGIIAGTPDEAGPSMSNLTIQATADNGSTAKINLSIPVRASSSKLVGNIKIMSYNLWHGGTQVNNYHEKQLRWILESGADIVGLQETTSDHATRLGKALGWYHWQSMNSVGIISRYPIVKEYGEISTSGGVRVNLNGNTKPSSELNVWRAHLGYTPYGPYDFCFDKMTPEAVMRREAESGRTPQITAILSGIQQQLDNSSNVPVILLGDFNAPSHLDWVSSLKSKNCGISNFAWPTSVLPTDRGLIDSFRSANPDPAKGQGITWSPIYPKHGGSSGVAEPQDRIDFVYGTSKLEVISSVSRVAGNPAPYGNHQDNEWTSDHAIVITYYKLP